MKLYFQTQQSIITEPQQKTVVSLDKLYQRTATRHVSDGFFMPIICDCVPLWRIAAGSLRACWLPLTSLSTRCLCVANIDKLAICKNLQRNKIMHKSLFSRLSLVGSSTLYEAHEYQRALLSVLSAALQQKSSTHDEETYLRILELIEALSFDMYESAENTDAGNTLKGDAA